MTNLNDTKAAIKRLEDAPILFEREWPRGTTDVLAVADLKALVDRLEAFEHAARNYQHEMEIEFNERELADDSIYQDFKRLLNE